MAVMVPTFTKVCEGLAGSEGPVFDKDGNFYAVAPMEECLPSNKIDSKVYEDGIVGKLYSVNLDTQAKTAVCTPWFDNFGGRPAGCQADKDNNIWIADMRLGVLKFTPETGCCTQISKADSDGRPMNGCNDLVFDKDGNLWVTGPGSPIAPEKEERISIFEKPLGCLYCLERGATTPVRISNQSFTFCNGIAVRDSLLLVAETMTQSIMAFDIASPGVLTNRREWAKLPSVDYDNALKRGGPDGMDFDERGRLLVAHHAGSHLEVFTANGCLEARIKCPFKEPSNLHFSPKSSTCYVTEHDGNAIWKFDWECKGMPMYCES